MIEEQKSIDDKPTEHKQPIRDTLYGRIDVSVKSVDRFIIAMLVLLVVCVTLGVVL